MKQKISSNTSVESILDMDNDRVYTSLFEAIVEHKLAPGTHLKEEDLCESFNMGRTRIRKILTRLSATHLVELVNNRGAFVAQPSIDEAREVFRARRLVEGYLVLRAAENASQPIRRALEEHLHAEQVIRKSSNLGSVIQKCGRYHQVLADQAASPIMAAFIQELLARSSLIVAIYGVASPDDQEFIEHQKLTQLVLEGKGKEAGILMDSHIRGIESRLDLSTKLKPKRDLKTFLSDR